MFIYAFLHNGCPNELRGGNVQPFTSQVCGKILLLKMLNFSEVERIKLYITRSNVSLILVFVILFMSRSTEVQLEQKMIEVACGIAL